MSWAEERQKLLDDIKKMTPSDRLAVYSSLIKLNSSLFESVRGWDSWLRNPSFMETFSEEELRGIFKEFQEITLRFLGEDVKWTSKKEKALPKTAPTARAERTETERRYA